MSVFAVVAHRVTAHDKLATAAALFAARVSHPFTVHVAPWLPLPELEPPIVFKPRFGSWGQDATTSLAVTVEAAAGFPSQPPGLNVLA